MGKVGGPRVFFDVLGAFNAHRLIKDVKAQSAVMESIVLDSIDSIVQSFSGIAVVIDGMTQATVHTGLAVGKAVVEFEKFAGENKELQNEIISTGQSLGFTADEALRAGAKMAQLSAIFGETTTAAATKLGQEFALISGMGTQEAMTGLINLQQQTGFMYGDMTSDQYRLLDAQEQRNTAVIQSTKFLDEMNTVENKSAATMKGMIFVMNQFAAQAHTTGESIANMAAMSATLIEAGEEQGKAGRALRMIYARLGSNIQDNNEVLAQFGVEAKDAATGGVRPLSDILGDLAAIYPSLTAEQKQNISQTVAGNDHYVRFTKLIENYGRFSELATDAVENQSTAQAELNRVLESNTLAYEESVAGLENMKAEVGQGLLPAMTQANLMQTRLIEGFVDFGEGGFAVLGTIVKIREYSRILGGVFDMYLQMKSVNISMAVHESILKAIAGHEVVRTDSYRKQGIFSGITTSNQKELSLIMHEIAIIEDAIKMHKTTQQPLDEARAFQAAKVAQMRERQITVESKLADLNTRNFHAIQAQGAAYEEASMLVNTLRQHDQIRGEQTVVLTNEFKQQVMAKRNELGLMRSIVSAQQLTIDKAKAELLLSNRKLTVQEIEELKYKPRERALQVELETNRAILTEKEKELAILENIITKDYQLRAGKYALMTAQERYNDLSQEQLFLFNNLGIAESELMSLDAQQFAALMTEIALLDDKNQKLRQQQLEQIKANLETYKAIQAGRTLSTEVNRMNIAFSKFSMAAGLASMALGIFGDDTDSAQASIILMTVAMIPAIGQMSMMSIGMTQAAVSAGTATAGVSALNLALKSLLMTAGLAIPLAILSYGLAKIFNKSKDANAELGNLNDTLKVSRNLLKDISEEEAKNYDVPSQLVEFYGEKIDLTNKSLTEMNRIQQAATQRMLDLKKTRDGLSENDPVRAMLQDDINALSTFATTASQLKSAQIGLELVNVDSETRKLQILADAYLTKGTYIANQMGMALTRQETALRQVVVTSDVGGEPFTDVQYEQYVSKESITNMNVLMKGIADGSVKLNDLTTEGRNYLMNYIDALEKASTYGFNETIENIGDMGEAFTEAEDKMRAFANAREELFFGGKSSYMSGDMMKQVVNKGVENLYSNVELIMTNNFYGLTFNEAVDTISDRVVGRLLASGVPMNTS